MKNGMEIGTDLCSEVYVDVDKCGADLNSNGVACWQADLLLEVKGFWKTYLHWTPVKVVVFEAKPKNQFKGKHLRFDNWFQMVKTLVEARSMNQSQSKKKAPVLKDVLNVKELCWHEVKKTIVAKETLSSEAKETLSSEAKENIIKWSQRKCTASTKTQNKKFYENLLIL